jgi:large repetitive protein
MTAGTPTRRRRAALVAASALAFTLTGVAAPAWAYWSVTSASSAAASASTLQPAVSLTVTATGATTLRATVTGPPASGPTPTGYRILRGSTTVCASAALNTPCNDSGLAYLTGYSYTAVSLYQAWTSSGTAAVSGTTLQGPTVPSTPALTAAGDSGTAGDGITAVTAPSFTGTATVGSVVTLLVDGTAQSPTATVPAGGTWTITPTAPAANTPHSVTAVATLNGATSPASAASALYIDAVAPTLSLTNGATACSGGPFASMVNGTGYCKGTLSLTFGASDAQQFDGVYRSVNGLGTPAQLAANRLAGTTDTQATDGTYRYAGYDVAGNPSSVVAVVRDTVAPSVANVALLNGTGTAGTLEAGDQIRVTFSEPVQAGTVCTGTTGVVIADGGNGGSGGDPADVATFTGANGSCPGLTSLALTTGGAGNANKGYVSRNNSTLTFGSSTVAWDSTGAVLTITLGGTPTGGATVNTGVVAAAPTLTLASSVSDLAGNPLSGTSLTSGSASRF